MATDQVVLMLYQNLNALQPQLLKEIDDVQQKKAAQEKILHKVTQAKDARVSLNTMRRMHLERIRQQEQEQSVLARMQMEQKLALLRQQKAEQMAYQEALRQERMVKLTAQQQEYEQQIQEQRERERLQLIAQEQQVLQSHFGGGRLPPSSSQDDHVGAYGGGLGGSQAQPAMSMSGQYQVPPAMTFQEAPPLPAKVEPDMYHPPPYTASEPLYQPILQPQSMFYQPPPPPPPQPHLSGTMPHGTAASSHSSVLPPFGGMAYHPSAMQPAPTMYAPSPPVSLPQTSGLTMQSVPGSYQPYSQPQPTAVQRQESQPPLIVL